MTRVLTGAAGLAAIYLLVMTSLDPADVVTAAVLGLAIAAALRPRRAAPGRPLPARARALAAVIWSTAIEMARGSWRVVRFCLGAPSAPGFVEIPRDGRSRLEVALWAVVTGEAPDEFPVDVDTERDVLIVHVVDAGDPDAIRARHHEAHVRHQREVLP